MAHFGGSWAVFGPFLGHFEVQVLDLTHFGRSGTGFGPFGRSGTGFGPFWAFRDWIWQIFGVQGLDLAHFRHSVSATYLQRK